MIICIYYDYEGIEKWATHQWKANKIGTQNYQKFMDESRQKIQISFIKVLAHSGDIYNEIADFLFKRFIHSSFKPLDLFLTLFPCQKYSSFSSIFYCIKFIHKENLLLHHKIYIDIN